MQNYFKRLFGNKKGFVFTTKNLAVQTGNGDRIRNSGDPHVLQNFVQISDWTQSSSTNGGSTGYVVGASATQPKVDERKAVEPKAVFEEIKKEDIEIDFSNLNNKITSVKERLRVLREHLDENHLADEYQALFFLENRKKYLETQKKCPLDWAMTNREAIDDLCKRYKLQTVPLKQYYTLVPKEGIKEMERYTKAYKAITGDNPIYELVIKDAETKPEEKKERTKKDRDPILLANSPLGNFMFVIGAWDDEVEYIDEIIYNGK